MQTGRKVDNMTLIVQTKKDSKYIFPHIGSCGHNTPPAQCGGWDSRIKPCSERGNNLDTFDGDTEAWVNIPLSIFIILCVIEEEYLPMQDQPGCVPHKINN